MGSELLMKAIKATVILTAAVLLAGIMLLANLADFQLDDLDRMHRTNIRGAFVISGIDRPR